jgi:ribonuclease BN (tRNA processing enzyme)
MSDLHLTVLGSGPSWPNPGGACSGYLVSANGSHVLLDCGPGVAGRLLATVALTELSAIVISHLHSDHFLDVVSIRQALTYGKLGGDRPPRLLVPPGGAAVLAELGRALNGEERFFAGTFDLSEYDPTATTTIGPFNLRFRRVLHPVPAFAMRIESGGVLTFSGDSAPCDALVEHARGADTLLCEATWRHPDQDDPDSERRVHTSAREAGEIARRAGARRLILTHCPIDPTDPDRPVRDAEGAFRGPVELAREGERYTV